MSVAFSQKHNSMFDFTVDLAPNLFNQYNNWFYYIQLSHFTSFKVPGAAQINVMVLD